MNLFAIIILVFHLGFFLAFMLIVNQLLFRPMRAYLARRQRTIDNLRAVPEFSVAWSAWMWPRRWN